MYTVHWKKELPSILVIIAMVIAGLWSYPVLPEKVPTHWNIYGQIDAYSSKTFGVFFFLILVVGLFLLMLYVPYLDPKRDKYSTFEDAYRSIRLYLIAFFALLYGVTLAAGFGYPVEVARIIQVALGILFMVLGNLMGKVRQNWFVGFKLPWTLETEDNWNKTHRFGGKCFVISGLIMLLAFFLPLEWAFVCTIGLVFLSSFVPMVYSYCLYKKTKSINV